MKEHLLLLHGALGSKEQLQGLKQALDSEFEVHLINFSGHGGRTVQHPFSMDLFKSEVINAISGIAEAVHVFGYSMGGYAALAAASEQAELFRSIVTLGTKFDWTPETAGKEAKLLNPLVIEEKVPAFAQRLAELHQNEDWKVVVNKTAEMMMDLGDRPLLDKETLSSIPIPVTIGLGELDNMVSREESLQVSEWVGAHFVVLEQVKHPIEQVDTKVIADYIREHIDRLRK